MGEVIDLGKQAYWARKRARQKKQDQILDAIVGMSDEDAAGLLFDTWPEHLPKRTRGRIKPGVRARWWWLNKDRWLAEMLFDEYEHMEQQCLSQHILDVVESSVIRHRQRVDGLIEAMEQSVRGQATFAIGAMIPDMGVSYPELMEMENEEQDELSLRIDFHGHYSRENGKAVFTNCKGEKIDHQVRKWMSVAMDLAGGMVITEELPIKRLTKDGLGNDVWLPQVKSYALSTSCGDWFPATPQEAQHAATHDEDGDRLPQETGVSYSQLKKPSWLNKVLPYTDHLELGD